MKRRSFIRTMVSGMAAAGVWPAVVRGAENASMTTPPVRAITRGPGFHWFGYYDKFQFDSTNRYVLGNEVSFEGRSPKADDEIRVGMVDLQEGDRWRELGSSKAWNWQQGCMLQWIPGTENKVIWNDREGDHFVARILDVKTRDTRTLSSPIYNISPDGKYAVAPDFRRLNDCRPGYGYAGLPDPNRDVPAPSDAGIWRVEMETGKVKLLFSFEEAMRVPYTGRPEREFKPGAKHWFNHLLFNTDGTRFFFLHRWRNPGQSINIFYTRAFTCDRDGKNWYCLDPHGDTSHFIWRDPEHVMAWAWHPSLANKFYLYKDRTDKVEAVGPEDMTVNGHNTYLPGTENQWVLNDTYPDKKNAQQHVFLYHIPSRRRIPLADLVAPPEYKGEWRCDTHPRSSRDGRWVCVDSAHAGGRQMYLIDVSQVLKSA